MKKDIGNTIKTLRFVRKISQQDLSKKAKVSQSTIAQIESGRTYPSIETLIAIAKALGVSPGSLLEKIKLRIEK